MSHFSVAIFTKEGQDIRDLLKPYNENIEVPEYIDEDGERSTYNPKSKWDWYSIGGRWENMLNTKDGKSCNSAKVKDLLISENIDKYKEAERFWEVIVEDDDLKDGENKEDFFSMYNKQYYLDRYKTKETYAKIKSLFTTFAVITPDGKWYEKGKMGFFGFSSESHEEAINWDLNYKERFIDTANPEWTITIVDCHI